MPLSTYSTPPDASAASLAPDGGSPSPAETARRFAALGIGWLTYKRGVKDPHRRGWQNEPTPPIAEARDTANIGVRLHDGLVDVESRYLRGGGGCPVLPAAYGYGVGPSGQATLALPVPARGRAAHRRRQGEVP